MAKLFQRPFFPAPAGALQGGVYRSGVVGARREARRESPRSGGSERNDCTDAGVCGEPLQAPGSDAGEFRPLRDRRPGDEPAGLGADTVEKADGDRAWALGLSQLPPAPWGKAACPFRPWLFFDR
mgnify:FL=1